MTVQDNLKGAAVLFGMAVFLFLVLSLLGERAKYSKLQEKYEACLISEASYREKYEAYRDTFVRFRANHPESGNEIIIVEKSKD